jgi:hypothetical protein
MRFLRGAFFVPVVSIALAGMGSRSAGAHGCVVAGGAITLDADADVMVHPPGEDPFGIRWVETRRLKATIPSQPDARTALRVSAAISFNATAGSLWYDLARPVDAAGGMVKLRRGARLAGVRADGGGVVGSVVMNDGSGVPGVPAETAGPVRAPCSALTVGVDHDEVDGSIPGDGTWWRTRRLPAQIELHARPDTKAPALVVAMHPNSSVPLVFARLEVRGTWMRVARPGSYTTVIGWVLASELEQTSAAPGSSGGGPRRGPGLWGEGRRTKPPYYDGPARIAAGTTIFAERGRGPWAKVETRETFKIRYDEGATWAEITEIPGVRGPEIRAYVPVSATTRQR